jgi:hypothetical protein
LKKEEMIAILSKEWALGKMWYDRETEWERIAGAVVD